MLYAPFYNIAYDIAHDIAYYIELMDAWSDGLCHFKKDMAYNTSKECCAFHHDVQENSLLNDVFCYIIHNLPKL